MASRYGTLEEALNRCPEVVRKLYDYGKDSQVSSSFLTYFVIWMDDYFKKEAVASKELEKARQHAEAMTVYAAHLNDKLRDKR